MLVVLLGGAIVAFRGLGRWLIREDPLAHADVLVVLSGSMPSRAEEAATLFQMGYAPEVWVSRPPSPASELAKLGISYAGEEIYNRDILIREGVPANRIHIFPDAIVDTEQEVREVARKLREEHKTTAIIVTSPQHTRRVRTLWGKLAGANVALIVRGVPGDPFNANHWWRNTRDAFAVAREALGLVNAWIGLPVRPHAL